jgi:putative ubiquitin-RnfH superfamily antitoxin RatB of RatAB toxin-antitoxin module
MSMHVSVAYCPGPRRQTVIELDLPDGATALQAIEASRLLNTHPELGSGALVLGVYGERVTSATVLREGDRVEIYRPLKADPKQARRRRAARAPGKK